MIKTSSKAGIVLLLLFGCGEPPPEASSPQPGSLADVVSVSVDGAPGAFRFAVGIRSPDTGCERYADWWEVVASDGRLIHRRVLSHSHVEEQPFVRRGGPVPIEVEEVVWVRAHMHPGGYGGVAFQGSVQGGFRQADLAASFAGKLAAQPPQPPSCRF